MARNRQLIPYDCLTTCSRRYCPSLRPARCRTRSMRTSSRRSCGATMRRPASCRRKRGWPISSACRGRPSARRCRACAPTVSSARAEARGATSSGRLSASPRRRAADQEPGRRRALLRVPHLRRGRRRGRRRRVPDRRPTSMPCRRRWMRGLSAVQEGAPGHRRGRAFPPGDRPRFAQPVFRRRALETSVGPIRQFIELARNVAQRKDDARDREVQREHQAIVDAIVRRSPAEAVEATRAHTVAARRRIFEGTQLLT